MAEEEVCRVLEKERGHSMRNGDIADRVLSIPKNTTGTTGHMGEPRATDGAPKTSALWRRQGYPKG